MRLEIEVFGALCSLSLFEVNGIDAEEEDFVDKYDHAPEGAEEYGCGNMKADVIKVTDEILDKYRISSEEYYEIAEQVAEKVSFGHCGWCV